MTVASILLNCSVYTEELQRFDNFLITVSCILESNQSVIVPTGQLIVVMVDHLQRLTIIVSRVTEEHPFVSFTQHD